MVTNENQQFYSVPEAARLTGLSRRTIIRKFEHAPGVLKLVRTETRRKRRYRSFRIPKALVDMLSKLRPSTKPPTLC